MQTDKQTDRQTHTQTHRGTDTHWHTLTHIDTHWHKLTHTDITLHYLTLHYITYTHTHIHTHTQIHTQIHTYTHIHTHTHTHTWQTVCRLWVTSCFPSGGSGYSSLRPFSAKKMKLFRSEELQNRILLCTYWWKTVSHWNGMKWRKNSRYVELIRLHILVYCMELRWRQPCSDSVAPCC